jgi:hypothetical protein
MKNLIKAIKVVIVLLIILTFVFPYLDEGNEAVRNIRSFGLLEAFLACVIPLAILQLILTYYYDRAAFNEQFSKENLWFKGAAVCIIIVTLVVAR